MSVREDGLPQSEGEYLGFHSGFGFGIFGYRFSGGFGCEQVTHWWSLPEPPYPVPMYYTQVVPRET